MTATWLLAAAAVWWATARPDRRRVLRERLGPVGAGAVSGRAVARDRRGPSPVARAFGAAAAACVPWALLESRTGVLVAAAAGGGAWFVLGTLEPADVRRRRAAVQRDLPLAVDLLAACAAAGASTGAALGAAGRALEGEVGSAFIRAAAAMNLGATTDEAVSSWHHDEVLGALAPVARTLVRSATSGSALVPSVTRLATELRSRRRWQVDAVARRAGVRATVPLGVCFLPAFVLLGVVPTVLAGARGFVP